MSTLATTDGARDSFTSGDAVARAVLYEGFSLYPYRGSSLKNRKRLLFGTLVPVGGEGPTEAITEVLAIADSSSTRLRIVVRFLGFEPDREESVVLEDIPLDGEIEHAFVRGGIRGAVIVTGSTGMIRTSTRKAPSSAKLRAAQETALMLATGQAVRDRDTLCAHRLRIVLKNESLGLGEAVAMGAAHVVLSIVKGRFVSAIDPPAELADEAARCRNSGLFPVLVGDEGATDAMLAAPIILYDYPRVASQSAGDLFDATEIEEILSLRILTLTDAEKDELRKEPRTRALLERVERLDPDSRMKLHGVLHRSEGSEQRSELLGARVRLCPKKEHEAPHVRADAFDVLLRGMDATVVSVEHTVDGGELLCVTIDADPGRDLGAAGIPGHRFFFRRDEVEVLA